MDMYVVVARDFYREHPPILYKILAPSKEVAEVQVIVKDFIKEVIDCVKEDDFKWDAQAAIDYWKRYSSAIDEGRITESYLNHVSLR